MEGNKLKLNDKVLIKDDRFIEGLLGRVSAIKLGGHYEVYCEGKPVVIDKSDLEKIKE